MSGPALQNLKKIDFGDSAAIADIAPLKGYTSLEYLDIEKVEITEANRTGYRDAIRSLTNLKTLYMPYCYITDEDTEMFSTLQNLEFLVLNMNELTNTAFCDRLPSGIKTLSLHGNDIGNMDSLAGLTNLEVLGLGDNNVTDFTFISKLPSLTAGYIRHEEGTESFPACETYYYGSPSSPIEIENGQISLDNPYIGRDGKLISFANAAIVSSSDSSVALSYDAAANKVILGNIPASASVNSITVQADYDLPVSNGEYKVCELR